MKSGVSILEAIVLPDNHNFPRPKGEVYLPHFPLSRSIKSKRMQQSLRK